VLEDPYIILKNGLIVFYYVNDIAFVYYLTRKLEARKTVKDLEERIELTGRGELKWFLGI
jgi:hypothetical protein